MRRTEQWNTKDGRIAVVEVDENEQVIVSYELLAEMLTDLGLTRES